MFKVLGIHKDPWHNTGAAAVFDTQDGVEFFNLSEERCDRVKDSRAFPKLSIKAAMSAAGVKNINDFDLVVLDYIVNGEDWREDYHKKKASLDNILKEVDDDKIVMMNHHLAHAYNVFYSSEFDEAAILIIDGRGSSKETQSLFHAKKGQSIEMLDSTDKIGIGLLYAAVTQLIGFKLLQEGKTMGLAPYGRNAKSKFLDIRKNYEGIVTDYSDICVEDEYLLKKSIDTEKLSFDNRAQIAFEVQQECEEAMIHLAQYAKEKTGAKHLCISGGVALNSVANYKVLQSQIFEDVFINPAASDTGIPLGAALYGYHNALKQRKNYDTISPFLGTNYSEDAIKEAIGKFDGYKVVDSGAFQEASEILTKNLILGVFFGRSEMGPRALGHRSILMSPLLAENKDTLNKRVKFRESFRPFAPVILDEFRDEYFDIDRQSPYMLFVPNVKKDKKEVIPAVTHVDGTGRLQTVTENFSPHLYNLIKHFHSITGVPVILNTSFNVAGEPIVETPEDAIKCFLGTNIDALLIEDYLLIKDT